MGSCRIRHVRFTLMNSFSTSEDTLAVLKTKYPALASDEYIEVVQNKAPKIEREPSFQPAAHPPNPRLEWAPPGHGDLYATLKGSGMLEKLVSEGYKYMFVSNSDNLGTCRTRLLACLLSFASRLKYQLWTLSCEHGLLTVTRRGKPGPGYPDPLRQVRGAFHDGAVRAVGACLS